jgi:osmotically-inducible protein OsmY
LLTEARYGFPHHPAATDKQLEKRVQIALDTQPETRGRGMSVELDRGIVRLFGDVPPSVAKAAASVAKRIHGVVGVDDRTVSSAGSQSESVSESPVSSHRLL